MAAEGVVRSELVKRHARALDVGDDSKRMTEVGADLRGDVALHRDDFAGPKTQIVIAGPHDCAAASVQQQNRRGKCVIRQPNGRTEQKVSVQSGGVFVGALRRLWSQRDHHQPVKFR